MLITYTIWILFYFLTISVFVKNNQDRKSYLAGGLISTMVWYPLVIMFGHLFMVSNASQPLLQYIELVFIGILFVSIHVLGPTVFAQLKKRQKQNVKEKIV